MSAGARPHGPFVGLAGGGGRRSVVGMQHDPGEPSVLGLESYPVVHIGGWLTTPASSTTLGWLVVRGAVDTPHLIALVDVGATESGVLVYRTESMSGVPLPSALDRIGVLTTGVAITLTVPLLRVAAAATEGETQLGTVRADDILIDDSGAPVVVDRPPSTGRDGADMLVLACRSVWDRVDPREPVRPGIDAAFARTLDHSCTAAALADTIAAAAAARPVRWAPAPTELSVDRPCPETPRSRAAALARCLVHDGVPVPWTSRRVGLRTLSMLVVVAVGVVVAMVP